MNGDDLALLAGLPHFGWAFGLTLARIGGCVSVLPGLGETEMPAMVRAGIALGLTLLLTPLVAPLVPRDAEPESGLLAAAMVMAEAITGLWLGTLARLIALALPAAGQFASYMLGLANVLQPDPVLGAQATALGRMLGLAAPVLVLATGLYRLPLEALAGSYRLVPPGALLPSAEASPAIVAAVGSAFALALRLAAPFVLASIVWQAALALLARLIPRLQIYTLAMPGQILGGLALFAMLAGAMLAVWQDAMRAGFAALPGF